MSNRAALDWMRHRIGKIRYSQGSGRMSSDSSGVGDCSSVVCQALMATGLDADDIGTVTYTQAYRGTYVYHGDGYPAEDMLLPGDLILYEGWTGRYEHVEMYVGGGKLAGISNIYERGIRYKNYGEYYPYQGRKKIMVRRHNERTRSEREGRAPRSCASVPAVIIQHIVGTAPDGVYGPKTRAAVIALQRRVGTAADGIFGRNTARLYLLNADVLRERSRGPAVRLWQHIVSETPDGVFGPMTKKATMACQTWAGITADGIVGPVSKRALVV